MLSYNNHSKHKTSVNNIISNKKGLN